MVNIKIRIGISLFYRYAKYNYISKTITLYDKANEDLIESIINHEYLHPIIENLVNKSTAKKFDKLFQNKRGIVIRDADEYGVPK